MAIGDYVKTAYVNGTTPAINATNLNNIENKVDELDTEAETIETWRATGGLSLPGFITPYAGISAPTGWLLCNGAAVSRSTYSSLYGVLTLSKGTFTVTIASPGVVTLNSHGLASGDCIEATTTGALPTGLSVNTNYFVIYVNANSFRLATTYANAIAGTAINTSGSQSGTHTLRYCPWGINTSANFNLPDFREATPVGSGTWASVTGSSHIAITTSDSYALGQFKDDQMQVITGVYTNTGLRDGLATATGAFTKSSSGTDGFASGGSAGEQLTFNSANSSGARTGTTTHGKTIGVNYIIKT